MLLTHQLYSNIKSSRTYILEVVIESYDTEIEILRVHST
jgi:hypothetical protein